MSFNAIRENFRICSSILCHLTKVHVCRGGGGHQGTLDGDPVRVPVASCLLSIVGFDLTYKATFGTVYSIEWSLGAELWGGVLELSGVKFWSGKTTYYTCRFSLFDIF